MEWRILAQKKENCFFSSLFKFKGKASFFFLIWYVVLTQTHIKCHLKSLKSPTDRVYLHRFFKNWIGLLRGQNICVFQSFLCEFKAKLGLRTISIAKEGLQHMPYQQMQKNCSVFHDKTLQKCPYYLFLLILLLTSI